MTGDDLQPTVQQLMEQVERLKSELEEKTGLAQERLTRLQYLQADFDNYRKVLEKEKALLVELANEKLISDLLVILDGFERALPSLEGEKNREGITMLYHNLTRILADYGLRPIESVGKKFDPNLHEVMLKEKSSAENDVVLEDLEKGYRLKSRVIRPSKVKVAQNHTGETGENNG
jgi:molecular chaperone GrpE